MSTLICSLLGDMSLQACRLKIGNIPISLFSPANLAILPAATFTTHLATFFFLNVLKQLFWQTLPPPLQRQSLIFFSQ